MAIFNYFTHLTLSDHQQDALKKLSKFFEGTDQVFMLKGYAGSGKTTILKGLVEYLQAENKNFVLMAPTGRAAKVIREKTGHAAYTIHKTIYSYDELIEAKNGESFVYEYKLRNNVDPVGKIYIVDEVSMLSDAKSEGEFFRFGSGHLLSDLMAFTRVTVPYTNAKIIFVGDPFQLPPVTDNSSKAFAAGYLKEKFNLDSEEVEMTEVRRQSGNSGILSAAAKLRKSLTAGYFNDFDIRPNAIDIFQPTYAGFLKTWEMAESPKVIVAYKNKTCQALNSEIRERKFGRKDLPIQIGEIVILGGNNYRKEIFNGEFSVVNSVGAIAESRTIYLQGKAPVTLTWRSIELLFPDAESVGKVVRGQVLENFLNGENALKPEETQALYVDFKNRHEDLRTRTDAFKDAIIADEYFNCILLKYGYAVTCHKAQGGEWKNAFTVWDYGNAESINSFVDLQERNGKSNQNFYRWAYTAITRASETLYVLNPPYFNSYSSMVFIEDGTINALNELTGGQTESEELEIDDEMHDQLTELGLLQAAIPLQDHFIKVRHALRRKYIDIIGWEIKNLEVHYKFRREDTFAAAKTWVSKDFIFNNKNMVIPAGTNSEDFYKEIESVLKNLPNVSIKRDTVESIMSQIAFEGGVEEKFPFTRNLFDDLQRLCQLTNVQIENVEHLNFKERYTFKHGYEEVKVDFEYNGSGFYGRVLPLKRSTINSVLVNDIKGIVNQLKSQ